MQMTIVTYPILLFPCLATAHLPHCCELAALLKTNLMTAVQGKLPYTGEQKAV